MTDTAFIKVGLMRYRKSQKKLELMCAIVCLPLNFPPLSASSPRFPVWHTLITNSHAQADLLTLDSVFFRLTYPCLLFTPLELKLLVFIKKEELALGLWR